MPSMPKPEEREFTCYWIVNVTGYSARDAAQAAEDAMTDRCLGSVWHVVEGIVAAPEGAIEIETWEVDDENPDRAPDAAALHDGASVPPGG